MKPGNRRVVIGVIGADIHVVGNKVIEFALRGAGFEVTNLGIFTTQEEFIHAAKEVDAAVILVSSLYGHGELDCEGLRAKCIESGMADIKLYVGGNLVVGKHDPEEVRKRFLEMGFDRVGTGQTAPAEIISWLEEDLGVEAA
jgi:methylaspartate mutase sigma subunit